MLKKVIITGPESTGKSTLASNLAASFHTNWVPEYAREYLDRIKRPYDKNDLLNIIEGQLLRERTMEEKTENLLFYDTSLLVLKIWYKHKYGGLPSLLKKSLKNFSADLFLLPDIDLPWKFDPQREHPHQRKHFFDIYKRELENMGARYVIISGTGAARLSKAVEAVNRLLKSP